MTTAVDDVGVGATDDLDEASGTEPSAVLRRALTAIVILPFVTAVIRALRDDWFPIGDNALLFIRTRDVLTDDHPYLGSWTSASLSVGENMNNPGAMYDWLIAPFSHLLSPGPAAAIGVALINILAVCAISAASHRIGGWTFQRWALLGTALMAWSMGSELLIDIWQANALILPFFALLVITIGLAAGDDGLLPWAAVATSLLLQTHISYAYIVALLALGVVGVRWWQRGNRAERADRAAPWWRHPASLSVGIIAVLWAPSFWEQFFGPGKGNMSRLLGNSSGGDFSFGLTNAAQVVGSLGLRPPFWGRSGYSTTVVGTPLDEVDGELTLELTGLVPVAIAVVGIGLLAAVLVVLALDASRSSAWVDAAAGVIAAVVLVGSVIALSRLTVGLVGLSPHHVRWAWPAVAFAHVVLVWLVVGAWRRRRPNRRATVAGGMSVGDLLVAGAIGLVSVANVPFLAQASGPTASYDLLPAMQRIEPQLAALDDHEPVLFDISTLRPFEPYSATVMMWMQEQGIEFRVDDDAMVRQLGEARRADGDEPTTVFQLQGVAVREFGGPECLIAGTSAFDPDFDAAIRELIETTAAELAELNGTSVEQEVGAIVRREVDPFADDDRSLVGAWIDSAWGLYASGPVCDDLGDR